jgi:hypothetical protein
MPAICNVTEICSFSEDILSDRWKSHPLINRLLVAVDAAHNL